MSHTTTVLAALIAAAVAAPVGELAPIGKYAFGKKNRLFGLGKLYDG